MMIEVRNALSLVCVCLCAASGLLDCGGKGSSRPGDVVDSAGSSASGGAGGTSVGGTVAIAGSRALGGSVSVGEAGAAGAPAKGCAAPTADGFETQWMPPQATPGACSAEQIAQDYALCGGDSPKYDQAACRAFEVDRANSSCLGCLFTAFDGDFSGAILVLPRNHWLANTGGCEALVDGDLSATSCGAREQAASICEYNACINACTPGASDQDWTACRPAATKACDQYRSKTSCSNLPRYATCHFSKFSDYFLRMGELFCGSGSTTPSPEGGAGGADATGAAGVGGAPM